ncbi:NgoPII family restriction endonuclease [Bacillus paranthracis]|uniref:NgoPII family restriction endonuclease n=1 Tax=Bacillus paranthracis TaxID=2026186 RepID=UPI000278FB9C|nr:NgoPII family restriction endonuclease [Bacillus paranthracis]EJQ03966.1 hypothetical protein IC5_02764 [Bacillus cereus AND1407]MDG0908934.1 NgoPII family restriction endonuclease [Bacillus paranthracis]MDR4347251.1 NgoPII family restriction endonuclease [Bacillus paranthracis]TKC26064.1 NgoPII family restriction endonuclease [Bacillus paranthracis]HDR7456218.1 NgoPII family restriction endonuclease [Bacillus paranthracis]
MATTNVLNALMNLGTYLKNDITEIYSGPNRLNNKGEALEYYVKDAYCDSFEVEGVQEKKMVHEGYFSYLGNTKNPPDFIIEGGEAVEVKKMESKGRLQLNSSYPKSKLRRDDERISNICKECDGGEWQEKPMIYSIGFVPPRSQKINLLWFIDGETYAANHTVYKNFAERVSRVIENGFEGITEETTELARFQGVDSKKLANLRARPMWSLENPIKVFEDIIHYNGAYEFTVIAILKKERYNTYENKEIFEQFVEQQVFIEIEYVNIPSPNNVGEEEEVVVIHMMYESLTEARENMRIEQTL